MIEPINSNQTLLFGWVDRYKHNNTYTATTSNNKVKNNNVYKKEDNLKY